ncbi:tyrosine-type recombinase/integrase [Sphingomonas hankyongi]|uniref:Site-specific integrase n=1 Tax=Sphingomonas hankyongi TaxID=2908209 RepID=A0ABT0S1Z3_9SPHN|nr:site-specific integrase [Sphingomonas hankyongi]MCL6729880.1 site-specific integrase [Sphingomonas hankyongi]
MTKANGKNERIKRAYCDYLREANGRDEATIDRILASIARFEASTQSRDFKRFHREQAVSFKRKLSEALNPRTGERLSKSTVLATVRDLRAFFLWLAREPGFRSHIDYGDADYFSLSDKDVAVARARRERDVPTVEQCQRALAAMPADTVLARRDRALFALTLVTAARISALASFRLGHINVAQGFVDQDARTVRTKAAKTFRTYFMPVDDTARSIVAQWVDELTTEHLWGPADPLFPKTQMGLDADRGFVPIGIARQAWASGDRARDIIQGAFVSVGLPKFHPHSIRHALIRYAMALDLSPEEMKAWSQNLGHTDVLTTFLSYGQVSTYRQGELIQAGSLFPRGRDRVDDRALLEALAARLNGGGVNPVGGGRGSVDL